MVNGQSLQQRKNNRIKVNDTAKQLKKDYDLTNRQAKKQAKLQLFQQMSNEEVRGRLFLTKAQANAAKIDMSQYENFDDVKAGKVLGNLKSVQEEINKQGLSTDEAKAHWENYFKSLDKGQEYQKGFVENGKLTKTSIDDIKTAQAQAAIEASNFNASLDKMTIGAKVASAGLKLAGMALNMIAAAAASWAISKVVEGLYNIATAASRAKETAQDYAASFSNLQKTQSSEAKTISEISDEYDKYASSVNVVGQAQGLTSDELERYHEICNQVADIMPELVFGYDAQGNAIVRLAKKYAVTSSNAVACPFNESVTRSMPAASAPYWSIISLWILIKSERACVTSAVVEEESLITS